MNMYYLFLCLNHKSPPNETEKPYFCSKLNIFGLVYVEPWE